MCQLYTNTILALYREKWIMFSEDGRRKEDAPWSRHSIFSLLSSQLSSHPRAQLYVKEEASIGIHICLIIYGCHSYENRCIGYLDTWGLQPLLPINTLYHK